ncbi:MAG: hypothetical protein HY089_00175 [Ignavibacteriales bacterium]|nr:hypothetical protein [Ignavibacteriales bacterium]
MRPAQLTAQEVLTMFRRRRKLFYYPLLLVIALCAIGAFALPRKFESSTTIMVQKDEVLNPLLSFTMAVTTASEDRLRTFNEIVYSKTTVQLLIDSLKLDEKIRTEEERQELVKRIRKDIQTERPGPVSFRIAYLDTDPRRAQRAVTMIANCFIKTVLQVENQRNELAVEFFEKKLEELRQKFETSQAEMVNLLRSHINDMPTEGRVISGRIEDVDRQISDLDDHVKSYQRELVALQVLTEQFDTEQGKQMLFDLQRKELPYVGQLRPLVTRYDELTRRYTIRYPEVQKVKKQIMDLLVILRTTLEGEVAKQRKQRWEFEARRTQFIDDLKRTSVTQQFDKDKESGLGVYRGLYEEMKIKLEQARTTRDLGRRGGEQFIIIDPAIVPTEPAKPNRALIISGGTVLGIFLGILTVITAELVDSRIRSQRDISSYKKRIIAYIPERTAT